MAYLFPHEQFIKDNRIKTKDLTDETCASIAKFESEYGDLDLSEEDEGSSEFSPILKLSTSIIKDIQADLAESQSEEELPDQEKKEKVLEYFLENEIAKVTPTQLKAKGYPMAGLTRSGEKVGEYTLKRKSALDTFYHLTKTAQ